MDDLKTWDEWRDDLLAHWDETLSMLKEYAPDGIMPATWDEVVDSAEWDSEQGDVVDWPDDADWDAFFADVVKTLHEMFENAFEHYKIDPEFVKRFWDENTSTDDG